MVNIVETFMQWKGEWKVVFKRWKTGSLESFEIGKGVKESY